MPAGELQRLQPVAGLDGGIAMRGEQIVEELHVELVVLHDQNGLAARARLGHARVAGASGLVKVHGSKLTLP